MVAVPFWIDSIPKAIQSRHLLIYQRKSGHSPHLSIRDQTLAMAALICLADAVETAQGNPATPITARNRASVVSYGHRLVTRWKNENAHFRWGNAKLYRMYFEDYNHFVHRPESIRQELFPQGGSWAIVQADLTQFYDRIPRNGLIARLKALAVRFYGTQATDPTFFVALKQLFDWSWLDEDVEDASDLCKSKNGVGLPQGLAASGFFANAYMLDFDASIVALFDRRPTGYRWRILDYCRYVDDMRFVVNLENHDLATFDAEFKTFLRTLIGEKAPGLLLNEHKTQVMYGNTHAPTVPVAEAMQAVNKNVSGPLDIETARHALEMLDGLLAVSNSRKSQITPTGTGQDEMLRRILSVEPDVRNDTLERFVAHRWRRVYRSLRVMADADDLTDTTLNVGRTLLDQRAKTFAVELLRKWILDPSNVRLLRVSLDLYPSHEHLSVVLTLLRSYLAAPNAGPKERLICQYVAAEVLRAGATETGFVRDGDELPGGVDLDQYRAMLTDFATEQLTGSQSSPTWYLRQQALLNLAVFRKYQANEPSADEPGYWYVRLHRILAGQWPMTPENDHEESSKVIPLVLIAHRISGETRTCASLLAGWIKRSPEQEVQRRIGDYLSEDRGLLEATLARLPKRLREMWTRWCATVGYLPPETARQPTARERETIPLLAILHSATNPFQQETAALRLAVALTEAWTSHQHEGLLTPARIQVQCTSWDALVDPTVTLQPSAFQVTILPHEGSEDRRYRIPNWCSELDKWKNEVGQIIRAAVVGQPDYTTNYRVAPVIEGIRKYGGTSTSWFKRKHGLMNQRPGLGDRLLPISPWLSELLNRLLAWPGVQVSRRLVDLPDEFKPRKLLFCIKRRLNELAGHYCRLSRMPLYKFPVPELARKTRTGQFKIAVVQTALPRVRHYTADDPQLTDPAFRRKHRRHVSAMLRLLMKTLDVRNGYRDDPERVDLVLFPELSIHPDDVYLLSRFADSVKCMVFCGLVFHPMPRQPEKIINSGMWILPVRTEDGRSMQFVEQGKRHLTRNEKSLGITPYRPCQWLIEARSGSGKPWRLSAAICYDATDLSLAADLRNVSDAFIVAALNRDIGTFDAMVSALHYHMFQHVVLVNSAEYGGSTAQAPYAEHYNKVIVHHHGMDQPVVSVIELDFARFRGTGSASVGSETGGGNGRLKTKHPPAGLQR
jgi:hypothetical protein